MNPHCFLSLFFFLAACHSPSEPENIPQPVSERQETADSSGFFPVTDFILGQITEIRMKGVNPIKRSGNDSSWLKVEDLEKEMSDFLVPVIDTGNLKSFFSESRFLDQTIDAYTFIYEPKAGKPDSISLERWIIYVDPKKNKVRTIILEKKENGGKAFLTWEAGKSCKMTLVKEDKSGNTFVDKETTINWNF